MAGATLRKQQGPAAGSSRSESIRGFGPERNLITAYRPTEALRKRSGLKGRKMRTSGTSAVVNKMALLETHVGKYGLKSCPASLRMSLKDGSLLALLPRNTCPPSFPLPPTIPHKLLLLSYSFHNECNKGWLSPVQSSVENVCICWVWSSSIRHL